MFLFSVMCWPFAGSLSDYTIFLKENRFRESPPLGSLGRTQAVQVRRQALLLGWPSASWFTSCLDLLAFCDVNGKEKSTLQNWLSRCQRMDLHFLSGTQLDKLVASHLFFSTWKTKPSAYQLKVLAETFLRRAVCPLGANSELSVFIQEHFVVEGWLLKWKLGFSNTVIHNVLRATWKP